MNYMWMKSFGKLEVLQSYVHNGDRFKKEGWYEDNDQWILIRYEKDLAYWTIIVYDHDPREELKRIVSLPIHI